MLIFNFVTGTIVDCEYIVHVSGVAVQLPHGGLINAVLVLD